jgi:hypothetical protein
MNLMEARINYASNAPHRHARYWVVPGRCSAYLGVVRRGGLRAAEDKRTFAHGNDAFGGYASLTLGISSRYAARGFQQPGRLFRRFAGGRTGRMGL